MKTKKILVCGGAGFIGHHLARRLKKQGHYVLIVDLKTKEEANEYCDIDDCCIDFWSEHDLSKDCVWQKLDEFQVEKGFRFDEIYQLAADMGGAGYIFTGDNDFNIMSNSAKINILCAEFALKWKAKVFYSSSACMYPAYNQQDPQNPKCSEDSAYPAMPDSEYGWEKLFSERLYLAARKNKGLDVRIARFHNIYGPEGAWNNGKEKAPAAICRKVATSKSSIEVWGDGNQTRSFLFIEDCLDAIEALMSSKTFFGPVNIGSEEMVSINQLVDIVSNITNVKLKKIHLLDKPQGVRGRNSDNKLIREKLHWEPKFTLEHGLERTFWWIFSRIDWVKDDLI